MDRAQAVVVLAALSGVSGRADAQVLKGAWAALSGRTGWARLSCTSGCPVSPSVTPHGAVQMAAVQVGLNLGGRLGVGGEFGYWSKAITDVRDRVTNMSLIMSYYPLRRARAFVRAGVGRGYLRWEEAGVITYTGNGSALLFGVGLDMPVARNLSLGPVLTYYKSDMTPDGRTDIMWKESHWGFGAALTMHP